MRRHLAAAVLTAAALGAWTVTTGTTRAATTPEKTFLIPASEGYGVADCLSGASECGKVVADAWCEAQGYAASASYGVAAREDLTGAIETAGAGLSEAPLRITCRE